MTKARNIWTVFCVELLVVTGVVVLFGAGAHTRNNVWKDHVSLWSDVALKSPSNVRALNNLAEGYLHEGLVDRAIPILQRSIAQGRVLPQSYNNLGACYIEQGKPERAAVQFRLAIKAGANFANAYSGLGIAYQMLGQVDDAIRQHKLALRVNPDHPDAHINIGMSYYKKRWIDKAIEHFQRAIQIEPDSAEAHYNLGIAYGSKGKPELAYKEMSLAKKLSSGTEWKKIAKGIKGRKPPAGHQF